MTRAAAEPGIARNPGDGPIVAGLAGRLLAETRELIEPALRSAIDGLPPRVRVAAGYHAGLWDAARSAKQGLGQLVLHLPTNGPYSRVDMWATWNVVQFVLLVLAGWLTWVVWRRLGAAYGLYSLATLVIVLSSPAAVVPLVSLPRFLLADFPLFIVLAPYARVLAPTFAAIGAAAAIAFAHGRWIA